MEDAGSLQGLGVGAGGVDPRLQPAGGQPLGQPLQLAVTQEAVALQKPAHTGDRRSSFVLIHFLMCQSISHTFPGGILIFSLEGVPEERCVCVRVSVRVRVCVCVCGTHSILRLLILLKASG